MTPDYAPFPFDPQVAGHLLDEVLFPNLEPSPKHEPSIYSTPFYTTLDPPLPSTSCTDLLASVFTPTADDDLALSVVPEFNLPSTLAQTADGPLSLAPSESEPCEHHSMVTSAAVEDKPVYVAASPVTPATRKVSASPSLSTSPGVGSVKMKKCKGRGKRQAQAQVRVLPEEWRDIAEVQHMDRMAADVPDAVVESLFDEVQRQNREKATEKKKLLREQLKDEAKSQHGRAAEISSRREAKVSRVFQNELRMGCEAQLKVVLKRFAALWKENQRLKQRMGGWEQKRQRLE